jgi:type I restriction-modification system DNA methylase subunit
MNDTASIVSKVWSFCHTLRDDGVSYGDYLLEQLTYLLFLKMADEYSKIYKKEVGIPAEYNWDSLKARKGADLEAHYVKLLRALGQQKGMIGQIFVKSQNQIRGPTWKTSPIRMCWPKRSSKTSKRAWQVSSRSWNRLMDNNSNRACGTSRNSH